MQKLKVATVVGTRPEIIRLSRVMAALDEHCDHTLIHTGQNYDYELNQIFFDDLEIRKPDYFLEAAGETSSETIGKVLISTDKALSEVKPEALLVLGDTNSCISVLAAKRQKIPTFHMEAGNRCFDERVPEEINRRIVDHTADINLTYSTIARDYLLREGVAPETVIKTGSPMYEVLNHYKDKINASNIVTELGLANHKYFVVSCHREENVSNDETFSNFVSALNAVAEKYSLPIIVSTHPRTRARVDQDPSIFNELIRFMKPLGFSDYVNLQQNAKAVLSDSGTITEESSILNFPAINIREAHERPEGMEEASVMLTGMNSDRILQALHVLDSQPRGETRLLLPVADYIAPNVSEKVVRIILSYTDYVNRTVWKTY